MKKFGIVLLVGLLAFVLAACGSSSTTFKATLSGAAEVPSVTTSGTGSATLTLEGTKMSLTGTYSGLSGAATMAHIHGPASKTENAGVLFALMFSESATVGTGTLSGSATITDAQVTDLKAGKYYVNVHTAANAGGELRGQLE